MKLKSGTLFGIVMIVVFAIALVSAVFSRLQMNDYLETQDPGGEPVEEVEEVEERAS